MPDHCTLSMTKSFKEFGDVSILWIRWLSKPYKGGITAVRDESRRWKQRSAEVFTPLAHPPGEAQFDFGEAKSVYRGREIKVMFCVMSLPFSDAFFGQAFPRECTETFQAGHVEAFEFFGAYEPTSVIVTTNLPFEHYKAPMQITAPSLQLTKT